MKTKWTQRIETLANIALIMCCILAAAFMVKKYFVPSTQQAKSISSAPVSLVGTTIALKSADLSKSQQNVLLILQRGCRFCDESAPFYQRLTKEMLSGSKTHLIAVMPNSVDEDRQYLREKGIEITDVAQASAAALGVRGTPTLLLVDNAGKVLEQWNGKLPATEEDKVIWRLKQ